MIKLKSILNTAIMTEMPHGEIDNDTVIDLHVEEYPIASDEKQKLIRAFYNEGVYGYSQKYESYLFISSKEVKIVSSPMGLELPSYWEESFVEYK